MAYDDSWRLGRAVILSVEAYGRVDHNGVGERPHYDCNFIANRAKLDGNRSDGAFNDPPSNLSMFIRHIV